MIPLKYNTASQEIPLGFFVDSTDGNTAETGLTIANTDIQLWKSGATTLANKNSGGATHISGGVYYATLDATDTNTYGPMKIFVHVSGALPVILECLVMEANAYDALYAAAGTGHVEANAVQISGDATAANNAESFFDGTGYAGTNNVIPTVTTLTGHTAQTGDNFARLGAPAGASVSADVAAVKAETALIVADTNELQSDDVPGLIAALNDPTAAAIADAVLDEALAGHVGAGSLGKAVADIETDVTAILADTNELQTDDVPGLIAALNDLSAAAVNAEVDTALSDIHLDHLLAATYDPASKPGAADALLNELIENDGGVSRYTANALEQAPSGGTNPNVLVDTTAATVGSQTSLTLTAGSTDDDAYNDQAIAIYDASNSDYPSVRKVTDYTGSTKTVTLDSGPDFTMIAGDGVKIFVTAPGTTAPTAAENRIEMDSNSTQLAAIVADTNELQSDWVNGGRLDLLIDAILADTGELQTDWTDGGRLDLIIDAILADTNELQTDDVPGLIAALNDLSAAAVNAEVDTALADIHLDHLLAADYDPASKPGIATALLNELIESDGGVSRYTANALEQAPSGGGSLTADDVWDEVMSAGAPANAQTAREFMRLFASALLGKTNSGSGSQFIARDLADSTDRITAGLDSDGFRTSMTLDGS